MRYGNVAETLHLGKAISAYDYLSINGNSAAYVSSAIAKFIVEKFFSKPEKGFFIDPITYAFQDNIGLLWNKSKTTGEESIRKSIEKLIDAYGFPATKAIKKMPIYVSDFDDEVTKLSFCDNVLSFQFNLVYDHINQNDLKKYLDYVVQGQSSNIPQLRPKFLIAPYFYLNPQNSDFDKWLELNIDFLKMAIAKAKKDFSGIDVFGQIVLTKSVLLDRALFSKVANAYHQINCSGFTIWIDDLNEHEASIEELTGFVDFLKQMKLNNTPVYNMYGGYFSVVLAHKEIGLLHGVSHGLEYGENRKVYPVGGGIPVSKYYYYPIHQRMDFTDAFYLLLHAGIVDLNKDNWGSTDKYYSQICKCEQCKKVMQKDMLNFVEFESRDYYEIKRKDQVLRRKKASSDTKQNCLYHYLLCKKIEFASLSKYSLTDLLNELIKAKEQYDNCNSIKTNELLYLNTWYDVLSNC